jgi:hypothetical protein
MPVVADEDSPSDLFTLAEFRAFLQVAEFDAATAVLARELATQEIRLEVGAAVFDALTNRSAFKAIALAVAKRTVINPGGLRSTSQQIDDYTESRTWAAEVIGDAELTESERARIGRILGRTGGAFTIRPVGRPDVPSRTRFFY